MHLYPPMYLCAHSIQFIILIIFDYGRKLAYVIDLLEVECFYARIGLFIL